MDPHQTNLNPHLLFHSDGGMNTATVGKPAEYLAGLAGFEIPKGDPCSVARLEKTGRDEPPLPGKAHDGAGWYEEEGWEAGCERCIQ